MIKLDIKVGDTILTGKWRNKKTEVKEIGVDELGQPTINGKPILKCRIEKLMPKKKKVDESRKMNHIKLYEDFTHPTAKPKDPELGKLANDYLNKILKDDIKYEQIDPRKGEFPSDFSDQDGQTEAELTYGFKDAHGKNAHIAIEFTWEWVVELGRHPESNMDRFPEEREDDSILTGITLTSSTFQTDAGQEGEFDISQENKSLLQEYLEKNLPVTKIRNFKL